jgi:SsrA-binding protein
MNVEASHERIPMSVDIAKQPPYNNTMRERKNETQTILVNRRAFHDFTVLQTFEAGIALEGSEVKSVKNGKISFQDGFCYIKNAEVFLKNVNISQYPFGNRINHDPLRERKLLLHKGEILKLGSRVKERGYTLVPLKVYTKEGKVKVEIGLVKGKKLYNKREDIRKKDEARDMKRSYKSSNLSGKLK